VEGDTILSGSLWHLPVQDNPNLESRIVKTLFHEHAQNQPNAQDHSDAGTTERDLPGMNELIIHDARQSSHVPVLSLSKPFP